MEIFEWAGSPQITSLYYRILLCTTNYYFVLRELCAQNAFRAKNLGKTWPKSKFTSLLRPRTKKDSKSLLRTQPFMAAPNFRIINPPRIVETFPPRLFESCALRIHPCENCTPRRKIAILAESGEHGSHNPNEGCTPRRKNSNSSLEWRTWKPQSLWGLHAKKTNSNSSWEWKINQSIGGGEGGRRGGGGSINRSAGEENRPPD